MMASTGDVVCTCVLANQKTLKKFREVIDAANTLLEDLPWRDEPEQIIKGLQFILDYAETEVLEIENLKK